MQNAPPPRRSCAVRVLALAWIVVALGIVIFEASLVASALTTGQMRISSAPSTPLQVSRARDPALFHAVLLASMLLAMLCLYSTRWAWRMFRRVGYDRHAATPVFRHVPIKPTAIDRPPT